MADVELQDVRVFLILAEELHFGRTATMLGLTASRVSQVVARFERNLGAPLFVRTSRVVTLTEYGLRVRAALQHPYSDLTSALAGVRFAPGNITGGIKIGYLGAAGGRVLADVAADFEQSYPGCFVELLDNPLLDPFGPLLRGEVDLLATWGPFTLPGVVLGPVLWQSKRVLAVGLSHPLAARTSVTLEDLGDCSVARITGWPAAAAEVIVPATTPSGRVVRRDLTIRSFHEVLMAVARGRIVHPTIEGMANFYGRPDVLFLPITDADPISSTLLYREGPLAARTDTFLRYVQTWLLTREPSEKEVGQPSSGDRRADTR